MEELLKFYQEDYGGDLLPLCHRRLYLQKAAGMVDSMTHRMQELRKEHEEALKFASCSAADALWEYDRKDGVTRETNGDLTVTYASGDPLSLEQRLRQAVWPYLNGTGLLYRGVD